MSAKRRFISAFKENMSMDRASVLILISDVEPCDVKVFFQIFLKEFFKHYAEYFAYNVHIECNILNLIFV